MPRLQECPCGSGEWPQTQHDARGIFLCYTCDKCEAEKLSKYRPDVLTDSNYWADEEIDGDDEDLKGDTWMTPFEDDGYPGFNEGEDQSEGDIDSERDA